MKPTIEYQGKRIEPEAFHERCLRAAGALRAAAVGEGDVVALMMRNSPLALELMLAARWIGALWCPVNWHFKTEEVQFIVSDSGAKVFIANADLLEGLAGLQLHGVQTWVALRDDSPRHAALPSWQAYRDATLPLAAAASTPRGAMFYTSGTTGRPKGIRRAAANAEQAARGLEVMHHVLGFEPGMRALLSAPMYHSAPNSYGIGAAMESAHLFIEERFDAEDTLRLIERHKITHAYLVPTMYVRLLRLPEAVRRRHDLGSIRFVASTGSPCPPDVKRAMIDWWGPVIHEAYGSSELGYMTRLDSVEAQRKPGSAGRALPGVTLAILDDDGRLLPPGRAGLIYVHQPAFADFSYVGNDAARQRMERAGLKTLGDVGYLDEDGFLFIIDRAADMVISGGVNIYPAEIEAVLQSMPGVADGAVFGIPDAEFGEALAAAVQPDVDARIDAPGVRAFLKARLADYKIPKLVTFHAQLPREDTGKVFKLKLRDPYWVGLERRI
jgi:long-chain acyl-CoA synthetase